MPDLKQNAESIIASLGKALDNGIESWRHEAERRIEDVKTVAAILNSPAKLDIASSDAAVVIDFFAPHYGARHVEVRIDGGQGGHVELMKPLTEGRYRAIVLINKLPDIVDK